MTRIDGRILRTACDDEYHGSKSLFPADSKRLQYKKTRLNSKDKDGIVRKMHCRVAFGYDRK